MATEKDSRVWHANTAIIRFDGEDVGFVQNLQVQDDSGADAVYQVGTGQPIEINHNRYSYNVTIGKLTLRQNAPKFQFAMSKLGQFPPVDIEAIDRDYGTKFVVRGAEPVNRSLSINMNQRTAENVRMMALGVDG